MARKPQPERWCEVVAYDPGGTTGWMVGAVTPRDLISEKPLNARLFKHLASGQILGSEHTQMDQLVELVDIWPRAAVVGESFIQRIRNKALETDEAYSPVRINAVVRWWLATEERKLFKQSPSDAKGTFTNEELERLKLEPGGGHANRHARDGIRHGALFISRAREKPLLRHAAWPQFFNKDGSLVR